MPGSEEAELGSGRGGEVVQWCSCASAVLASADVEWTHRRVRAVLMRRPRCYRCGAHGDGAASRLNSNGQQRSGSFCIPKATSPHPILARGDQQQQRSRAKLATPSHGSADGEGRRCGVECDAMHLAPWKRGRDRMSSVGAVATGVQSGGVEPIAPSLALSFEDAICNSRLRPEHYLSTVTRSPLRLEAEKRGSISHSVGAMRRPKKQTRHTHTHFLQVESRHAWPSLCLRRPFRQYLVEGKRLQKHSAAVGCAGQVHTSLGLGRRHVVSRPHNATV